MKFKELKENLIKKGVPMQGFGIWLYKRASLQGLGLSDVLAPPRQHKFYPAGYLCPSVRHEQIWEKTYQELKASGIDTYRFSYFLLGIPPVPKISYTDPFIEIGNALTRLGQMLRFKV